MLGPELVRARRRGDQLELQKFPEKDRVRALEIAEDALAILSALPGSSQDEVTEALGTLDYEAREEKLVAGIRKLLLDEAEFGAEPSLEPVQLRKLLFERASARRADATAEAPFSREAVVAEIAAEIGSSVPAVEEALFADLKGAAKLTKLPRVTPAELVERYELAQVQGVLLRAVQVNVTVSCSRPEDYRALFHKLKFRQLLFRIEELPEGRFRLVVDGPFSLFDSVTKYGQKLALLVPALLGCDEVEIDAQVRWGAERKPLGFKTVLKKRAGEGAELGMREEISALVEATEKRGGSWSVRHASALLNVPGVGLCIPDLIFESPGRPSVHFELLGYWSRDAVWKRLEWAEAAPERRVLFAVSSRLRVSEAVVDDDASSALYVFKGTMNPKAILDRVEILAKRAEKSGFTGAHADQDAFEISAAAPKEKARTRAKKKS